MTEKNLFEEVVVPSLNYLLNGSSINKFMTELDEQKEISKLKFPIDFSVSSLEKVIVSIYD